MILPHNFDSIQVSYNSQKFIITDVRTEIEEHARRQIPKHLEICLSSILHTLQEECERNAVINLPLVTDLNERIESCCRLFSENRMEYSHKEEELSLEDVYIYLVNKSNKPQVLDYIIQFEIKCATVVEGQIHQFEKEMQSLKDRHEQLQASSKDTLEEKNLNIKKQSDEMEWFKTSWQSRILQLKAMQIKEYKNYLFRLYREIRDKDGVVEGFKIYIQKNVKQEAQPQEEVVASESFTVHYGNHITSTYHLRIQNSRIQFDFFKDPQQEYSQRILMASTLYSDKLVGLVLFVKKSQLDLYEYGVSANQDWFVECNKSTEFHFQDVATQIHSILRIEKQSFQAGDFFITKHSNIPFHIVFHLILPDEHENEQDRSETLFRPNVMLGYRSILKVADTFDVKQLIIPMNFLNVNKNVLNAQTETLYFKQSELFFKNTKGTLMELNHLNHKNSMSIVFQTGCISRELFVGICDNLSTILNL